MVTCTYLFYHPPMQSWLQLLVKSNYCSFLEILVTKQHQNQVIRNGTTKLKTQPHPKCSAVTRIIFFSKHPLVRCDGIQNMPVTKKQYAP
ncbi:hypothetical protein ERO13_D06G060150v2 [Gossypium hirsutum]|uniref:Uncharacterized protein n=2 Tax=Gossypium TaxID=3633 RepID=A0A5J5R1K8_GOSBA|nr:hypothetical protein ES319_D06G070000v1 [Gossypium barbadense]KAG4141180.1 hypothetical protein ERO13_D06G060150v2 [Gossypium hirsutum]TYG64020.1 hypothetical protein ES288_D06G075400v1 [Gossypium darwinii]